ncbi:MAG: hypothetical protein IT257_09735 [Chitinophagaceae bacterium]|nr:hypothetical protein [Chitinophagaceae bacterium]
MEPKEQSHYTFFSFPLSVGTNMVFIKLKSHSSLSFFTNFGYHFKHPKYRYYDGAGGFIASAGIGSKNSSKTISYKIGYEVEQDRSFRRTTLPGSPTFDYIYWQYINQVYVSIGFKL